MEIARQPIARTVEFGIYRDGDNNLDASQGVTLGQAVRDSAKDARVEYTVQDTTSLRQGGGDIVKGQLRTDSFTVADGHIGQAQIDAPHDMADPKNLAQFVEHVLDNAQASGAKQTWIELTDHGAGDGGGLEADSAKGIMRMPDMAAAIAQGVKLHAQAHPEDAARGVDGVVANQCLMASLGFADALSHAGVKYLAASPETMVSPGVPSNVADAIAQHPDDAHAMGNAIVNDVMRQKYGESGATWGPAAAFDVLDLDRSKMRNVENSVKALNDTIAAHKDDTPTIAAIRSDAKSDKGMVRFHDATPDMPWHSDRPAIGLYNAMASDGRLDTQLRNAAKTAANAVSDLVVAHKESKGFEPFNGSNYADAAGPTTHFPITAKQIDPWAPRVSETHNRFFNETDASAVDRVVA
ncbi:MAG: hypothetical protein M3R35_06395 [Candidatus Eremiobacteraeota bacterium]|nr:hypothetical protein [Candidatus Eremiobacteraeota bacterium]